MKSFRVNIKHYGKMLALYQTPVIPGRENSRSLSLKDVRTDQSPSLSGHCEYKNFMVSKRRLVTRVFEFSLGI